MECFCEQGVEGEVLKIDSRWRCTGSLIFWGMWSWSVVYDLGGEM